MSGLGATLTAGLASKHLFGAHQVARRFQNPPTFPKLIDPNKLAPFVDPLPIPPLAKPKSAGDSARVWPHYRLAIAEFEAKVHRDVPPTRFWGMGGSMPGPTIEARSGEGVIVDWPNELPAHHIFPIDHNLMGAEAGNPEVRTVVHLHGAKTHPDSDGYPESWYVPGRSATYRYPNEQEAAVLWYHDHAMGINRLNIYAGMLGLYIIRDSVEDALNLPRGACEIPLVLTDRFIRQDGQLYYPVSQRPEAPWVPEVFGNAILVNGKLLPYLEVEPRKYRFRLLNGSNGRFYSITLSNKQPWVQIGTDQGLLGAPVEFAILTLAPAERTDIVLDFAEHRGEQILLNDGVVPFMQIRVGTQRVDDPSVLPRTLRRLDRMPESVAVRSRQLTLDELDNVLDEPMTHLLNNTRWHEPITENPRFNSVEIWSFVNGTEDSHPIHLHGVRFQVLDRRPFDVDHFLMTRQVRYVADPIPPEPGEMGWKDTVRAVPAAVTRILTKFDGYPGRYVWHCHILEHEDNEMMRPYEILSA